MTTQTSKAIDSTRESPRKLFQVLGSLTKPADGLEGDERQKAESLMALSLIFIVLGFLTVMSTPIRDMVNGQGFTTPNAGGAIALVILSIAYTLSRTKYYEFGAYMLVAVPLVAVLVAGIAADGQLNEVGLFFTSLSAILASLLLSSQATVVWGFLAVGTGIFLYVIATDGTQQLPITTLMFIVLTTGILALATRIREQNLRALIAAQHDLKRLIAEAEEARAKAERSDQVKSTFLASMSHELRTPLNAIINFTRFVVKGVLGPVTDEQVETLNNVIVSGKHLLNLINDVLDMSKIESDSLNLFVSDDVNIDSILQDVSTTGRALLNEKPVEITFEAETNLPLLRGDQQRIQQVFLNIVSNACKFTDEGSIQIKAKQDGDAILVTIADTGPGIAAEDQSAVFEAFKQTATGLRQGGGTGLGMPITKSLIEAHDGQIRLDSTVGKGTTFTVRLPIRSKILTPTLIEEG